MEGTSPLVVRLRFKALLSLFLLLLVTACDPPSEPISEIEVEGRWVASGPNGKTGVLEFKSDKTFVGNDLPDRVFYGTFDEKYGGPPDWTAVDQIQGTWSTRWDAGLQEAFIVINIDGRGDQDQIAVKGRGEKKYISYYYTDSDSAEFLNFNKLSN